MSRRAKIVCTLGPATSSLEQVTALVESGMDVARLNFSHGAHADHATAYERVREASDRTGHAVARRDGKGRVTVLVRLDDRAPTG